MRWHDQIAGKDRGARLFDETTTRTFDAPEALSARFHEVHARSALNRVPGASRVPFGWTVNPYRGCVHHCTYCAAGDTRILMGDGRTKPLAALRTGDVIYGTERRGQHRRYVCTTVKDHWSSVKPAYRVTLADGTELVTSGDHRLLTEQRGWKYVTGRMAGPGQRPYLTTNDSLLGTGRFAVPPTRDRDYRLGYLCGMVRGHANLASYHYDRPGRRAGTVHRFGPALCDTEALDRTAAYLEAETLTTQRLRSAAATDSHREAPALSPSTNAEAGRIRELIAWPADPTESWAKGFLAGIFDAQGSAGTPIRIANADPEILGWTARCFTRFGFDTVLEPPAANGCRSVRLRGGLRQELRFHHLTDPAITRRRNIEGRALESSADLRLVSVEPLGKAMRLYDITTGTGDYIGDGVVHHNCFARPTHEYLGFDAGEDFARQIIVKVNAPEVLRAELRRPSWTNEHIALGTNTDPYQWVEKRYGLTRGILEVLRDARNPCSVLTKSPLLLRDLELFRELVAVTEFSACLSIPTLDERAWRATEPHTPHPRKRLEAVSELNAAGIPTGVLIAPLMPGINDAPEQVEELVAECEAAGAVRIGGQALFLRGATKDVFMGWLRLARPDLVERYEELYGSRAYLREPDRRATEQRLRELTGRGPTKAELAARFQRGATLQQAGHGVATEPVSSAAPRGPTRQEALF